MAAQTFLPKAMSVFEIEFCLLNHNLLNKHKKTPLMLSHLEGICLELICNFKVNCKEVERNTKKKVTFHSRITKTVNKNCEGGACIFVLFPNKLRGV